jgi:phage-related minor tail protein
MDADKHILQVRSNTRFVVNYDDHTLYPELELILITQQVKYDVNDDDSITKGYCVEEARFKLTQKGVNRLIGELQLLSSGLQHYEQLGASINALIRNSQEHQKGQKDNEEPEEADADSTDDAAPADGDKPQ